MRFVLAVAVILAAAGGVYAVWSVWPRDTVAQLGRARTVALRAASRAYDHDKPGEAAEHEATAAALAAAIGRKTRRPPID